MPEKRYWVLAGANLSQLAKLVSDFMEEDLRRVPVGSPVYYLNAWYQSLYLENR